MSEGSGVLREGSDRLVFRLELPRKREQLVHHPAVPLPISSVRPEELHDAAHDA